MRRCSKRVADETGGQRFSCDDGNRPRRISAFCSAQRFGHGTVSRRCECRADGLERFNDQVEKMIAGEYSVQAAAADVLKNTQLMSDAARRSNLATPLLDASHALFAQTVARLWKPRYGRRLAGTAHTKRRNGRSGMTGVWHMLTQYCEQWLLLMRRHNRLHF